MNNTFLKSLVILLSLSALVLLCLCVRQNRKQTALQLRIAELQKDVKGASPQDTSPDKNEHTLSRPQKSLARKNDADFKEIRSKESQKNPLPNEISIQELAEKEPSTYQALVRILHNNIKELSKQRDKLLNLMVSLKPNDLLSEEDIELMQDKLDEQIRTIDANLAFQEPPKSKFIFENLEEKNRFHQRMNDIIDRYCASETGLNAPDIIQYMNDYTAMVQPPTLVKILPTDIRKQK